MKIESYKIPNSLAINRMVLEDGSSVSQTSAPTNIIFCCDVSYSMAGSLSKMRKQLKNRIPDLVAAGNSITIIWFSGRGQAGILKEEVYVNNLSDLQKLNDAIDRFLVPIGMTSFLDPIKLASEAIDRMSLTRPDSINSFIFLTDGYNNDSSWSSILESLEQLESRVSSSAFIEYGYYANTNALVEMAGILGGEKIFSEDFESYEVEFEKKLKGNTVRRRAIDVSDIKKKLMYGFMFAINEDSVIAYAVENKEVVYIPDGVNELYFFSLKGFADGLRMSTINQDVIYASVYVLAERLKYKMVDDILSHLGDKFLLEIYTSSYGKQKLNLFKETVKSMLLDPALRFPKGQQEGYTPDPNQYCVMNMIDDLMEGENLFYPQHPEFNYERIGAKSVTKTEITGDLVDELAKAKTKAQVESVLAQVESPEFIYPENSDKVGQSFTKLVWNEKRANLSINTKVQGMVKLPKNNFGVKEVESYIYRAYTFIKDGILNITSIPVTLTTDTFLKLNEKGLLFVDGEAAQGYSPDQIYILNFGHLPIINRKMVQNISAKSLLKLEFELLKIQSKQKYTKELSTKFIPKGNTAESKPYSLECAKWLQELGITDYNGFSPKRELVKSGDIYMSSHLETKIKSFSSIPKISDAISKMEEMDELEKGTDIAVKVKPPTPSLELLIKSIKEIGILPTDQISDDVKSLLEKLNKELDFRRRELLSQIAQIKFSVILSRSWFKEFEDFSQNELSLKIGRDDISAKFDFEDKEVKI